MTLLADYEIKDLCLFSSMITPFIDKQVREVKEQRVISYGLSSYGYDIRLAEHDFRIFTRKPGDIVDPKRFNESCLQKAPLVLVGNYFVLPAHTYALGVSVEKFHMPDSITATCMGKSTYARAGVIVNVTPLEAGWRGHLTIEISNSSCADVRVYANEGIAQLLFHTGRPCRVTYADRNGKYQDQAACVVTPKV